MSLFINESKNRVKKKTKIPVSRSSNDIAYRCSAYEEQKVDDIVMAYSDCEEEGNEGNRDIYKKRNVDDIEMTKSHCGEGGGNSEDVNPYRCQNQCELCLKNFKKKSSLSVHLKRHYGVKDYQCDLCPARFHTKYELNIHVKKHSGKLMYKCKECGDSFPVAYRLKKHMMIHTGERPFQCEKCGEVFREQYTLNLHMNVHLTQGPFSCDMCGEQFPRLNRLTLHKRVHKTDGTYLYMPQKTRGDDFHVSKPWEPQECDSEEKSLDELSQVKSPSNSLILNSSCHEPDAESLVKILESEVGDGLNVKKDSLVDSEQHLPEADGGVSHEHCVLETDPDNVPHPSIIQEAITTGTLIQSQADDGKAYVVVFPKAIVERACTLFTVSPESLVAKTQESEKLVSQSESVDNLQNNSCIFVCDNTLDPVVEGPFQSDEEGVVTETQNKPSGPKEKEISVTKVIDESRLDVEFKKTEKLSPKKKSKRKIKTLIAKLYHCQYCDKDYKSSSSLNIHMRTHTGERPYYCDFCGVGFKQVTHLKSHVRLHTGDNPYCCHLCDQSFNQSSRLRYHVLNFHIKGKKRRTKMVKQSSVKNFFCKICDRTFLDSCFKTDHMKTHVDEVKNNFENENVIGTPKYSEDSQRSAKSVMCELCGLRLKGISSLNFHKKKLHGVTGESLEMAGKKIFTSNQTNEDVAAEFGETRNIEPGCSHSGNHLTGTKLSTRAVLPQFHETASNVKTLKAGKYQCLVCSKIFNSKSNAHVHVRLHADIRPYKCTNCSRTFRQISHLKDHAKVHTGEKPFKCSACPAEFRQSSGAKVHIKKHHKGEASVINNHKENNS